MYALGSREELEALAQQMRYNNALLRHAVNHESKENTLDYLEVSDLLVGMLLDSLADHFNGRN